MGDHQVVQPNTGLLVRRIIFMIFGVLAGVAPVVYGIGYTLLHPGGKAFVEFICVEGGAIVAPLLLSRWDRFASLKPGNRIPAIFLSAELSPPLLLLAAQYKHPME